MRLQAPFLLVGALLFAAPAFACIQEVDPCTGRPAAAPRPEPDPASGPAPDPRPDSAGVAVPPASRPHPGGEPEHPRLPPAAGEAPAEARMADRDEAERNRAALRLGTGRLGRGVRTGPAGSLTVPTAIGVQWREAFVGVGYQARTRYTRDDDAGGVIGVGFGRARTLALEAALTTYSTFRGAPFETGGLSAKLHRDVGREVSVAAGVENAVSWGGADAQRSVYVAASRLVRLAADPRAPFSTAVVTLGAGNGRFRREADDLAGRERVNAFAAVGVRVAEPLSVVADWTGQDLNAGISATPVPRVPLVVTAGAADITGSAGDGARFILSVGYGVAVPWRF